GGILAYVLCARAPALPAQPAVLPRAELAAKIARLPSGFEENGGQTDPTVRFLARGSRHTLFLTDREAVVVSGGERGEDALRLRLDAARRVRPSGEEHLPGEVRSYLGSRPERWRQGIARWRSVRYESVLPGIDLVFHGDDEKLELDWALAPGADPAAIRLGFGGARRLSLEPGGDLLVHGRASDLVLKKPIATQQVDGQSRGVDVRYVLLSKKRVGIRLGDYDRTKPLLVDPVLRYATYLGGSNVDRGFGIAVDAAGNAYVTGSTLSTDFHTTAGAPQAVFGGAGAGGAVVTYGDVFFAKLDPTLSNLVYATYLGGSDGDVGHAIAVDASGSAYVTGNTHSSNFPTTSGALRRTYGGSSDTTSFVRGDAFVAKLSPSGALVYSTYLGGSNGDGAAAIAVDAAGNAYVAGSTTSADFPVTAGAFQTAKKSPSTNIADAFVTKLNPQGSALVYSTYLGGTLSEGDSFTFFTRGIAVDAAGNAVVAGSTSATDFPTTAGVAQQTYGGGYFDAFVTKLNAAGSGLVYSTYIGGSGLEYAGGLAMDATGAVYVTGTTDSRDLHVTPGAFQTVYGGGVDDTFVAKLSPTGALVYETYLGGGSTDGLETGLFVPGGIAVDATGSAWVTGATGSNDFPVTPDAVQEMAETSAYKSTDGGATWFRSSKGLGAQFTTSLALDPLQPATLFSSSFEGIYKTTDAGASWKRVSEVNANFVVVDPHSSSTLYATTGYNYATIAAGTVLKSTDGGSTWNPSGSGLTGSFLDVRRVAVDPTSSSKLYATTSAGLFRSVNAGASWIPPAGPVASSAMGAVAVDPVNPVVVYMGEQAGTANGLFKSTDGGQTFAPANVGFSSGYAVSAIRVDKNAPSTVYAASDKGLFKSTNGGGAWSPIGAGVGSPPAGVNDVVIDPTSSSRLYAAVSALSPPFVYKSSDGGASWTPAASGIKAAAYALAVDPSVPSTLYAGSYAGLDAFVAQLSPNGSSLTFSTYLGGTGAESSRGIALDGSGNVYVTGETRSDDFPTRGAPPFQSAFGGTFDAFVAKLGAGPVVSLTPASQDFGSVAVGATADRTFTVSNSGTGTLTGTASAGAPFSVTAGASFSLGAGATQS
ncbi:MAG TPA: SBBP repeat-containing protein, partial [Thermoanaerobaculia bacterium]|nr:SBBP repeat-containing protein [Thermoanaerobaculia bacterium]